MKLEYKPEFLNDLTDEQFKNGLVKIWIPDNKGNVDESIWAYTEGNANEYQEAKWSGSRSVYLCNTALNFYPMLMFGTTVLTHVDKNLGVPVLDINWVKEQLASE